MGALDYFLKANLYAGLFAGCYWFLLRRHTFFGLNRTYLLASVVLSLTLASLPTQTVNQLPATLTAPVGVIALPAIAVSASDNAVLPIHPAGAEPNQLINWWLVGAWLYGMVASVLLVWLGGGIWKLMRRIYASALEVCDGYVRVQPADADTPTFSFFRYLVLNPADRDNPLILRHELVHIRQYHSIDVVALALLRAVFWACPALWLLERAVREVHEFLADHVAIRQVPNQPARQGVEQYARFLVDYAFGVRPDALTNGFFNPTLLKRRIQMIQQRATNRWALGKYALVLPLVVALLAMTTARQEITAAFSKPITVTGRVTNATNGKPLPGVNIAVKGSRTGTFTDADGKYQLAQLPENAWLAYSFVGFGTKEVRVNGKKVVDVLLKLNPNRLNGIVVTGYQVAATLPADASSPPPSSTETTGEVSKKIEGKVFTLVEQQPEFPGGRTALGQYLSNNLRYPAKARQANLNGTVHVQFTVANDGSIEDSFVMKGIGGGCNEEALRVINQMPLWKPGKQNGDPVAVRYILPVEFVIDKEDKRTGRYEPTFKPLGTPVGDYPTARSDEFPRRFTTFPASVTVPATKSETLRSTNRYSVKSGLTDLDFDAKPRYTRWSRPDTLPRTATIHIRANGPLGPLGDGQQPLYILDSLEIDKARLDQLDTKTIKSVDVLKGASASAYGEKGKNGVVIITTKKP